MWKAQPERLKRSLTWYSILGSFNFANSSCEILTVRVADFTKCVDCYLLLPSPLSFISIAFPKHGSTMSNVLFGFGVSKTTPELVHRMELVWVATYVFVCAVASTSGHLADAQFQYGSFSPNWTNNNGVALVSLWSIATKVHLACWRKRVWKNPSVFLGAGPLRTGCFF